VYVDEFQNFATQPFATMMSEARKFKLFLTIAEQSTEQQEDPRLTQSILANARTLIVFGTGSPNDERMLLPRFAPHIEPGEFLNLPIYHFYLKTAVEVPMEPTSGKTIQLENKYKPRDSRAGEVIRASRKNYAQKYVEPASDSPLKELTRKPTSPRTVKHTESTPKTADKLRRQSIGSKL
jgi:hypothetical protein